VAPAERVRLPLRWAFVPAEHPDTRSILWAWRAYDHTGKLMMSSDDFFETLTECMDDAKLHGYGAEGA
jgi:hypothetical protein